LRHHESPDPPGGGSCNCGLPATEHNALRAQAERSARSGRWRRARFQTDLRRQDPVGLGWGSDLLARRDGALVGEITAATVIKSNTFIIWNGGKPKDFELKLEYRITPEGNSGINYRSAVVPDTVTPGNKFAMRGYQCDLDGRKRYPGNNYEEKGRLFLAVRGQMTRVVGGRPPVLVSTIGDSDELAKAVTDDWNSVHVIARGNVLTHIVNGRLMTVVVDDDAPNRPVDGLIGVQVHVGPPMKVEYRQLRLKGW
jgi:hypothetical protein